MPRFSPLLLGVSIPVSLVLSIEALTIELQSPLCLSSLLLSLVAAVFEILASIGLMIWCWHHSPLFWSIWMITCGYIASLVHAAVLAQCLLIEGFSQIRHWFYSLGALFFVLVGSTVMLFKVRRSLKSDRNVQRRAVLKSFSDYQAQLILLISVSTWYIIFGAFVFSAFEGWQIDDAVYFCIVSLTTVGLGDLVVQSTVSMILLPFYSAIGLLFFGMTVYTVRQVILEFLTIRVSLQLYRILSAWSMNEDVGIHIDPQAAISAMDGNDQDADDTSTHHLPYDASDYRQLVGLLAPAPARPPRTPSSEMGVAITPPESQSRIRLPLMSDGGGTSIVPRSRDDDQISVASVWATPSDGPLLPPPMFRTMTVPEEARARARLVRSPTISSVALFGKPAPIALPLTPRGLTTSGNQAPSDEAKSVLILNALRRVLFRQMKYAACMVIAYVLIVSAIMAWIEHWGYGKSIYFVLACITTVGYGDIAPKTVFGRSLFSWFLAFGIGLLTYFGSVVAELISNQWKIHVESGNQDQAYL